MGQLDPVAPRYGQASLAEVMPSVLNVLGMPYERDALGLSATLAGVRRVAVVLLDGLGWHQLGVASPHAPTLTDMIGGRLGTARSITSGFPSTTPVSLVTLGTGAPPGAHGIVGIVLNQPGTDKLVNHLRWQDQPDPAAWQPLPTAFTRAANAGIPTTVVSNPAFQDSGLSLSAYRGARFGAGDAADAVASSMLAALASSALVFGYLPDVDRAGHDFGIGTGEWRTAVADADRLLTRLIDGLPPDSALIVTADHGQLDIPADRRLDLDRDARLREGVAVVAGEPRVRYLHTIPGATADVMATWRGVLGDRAWVVTREEAVASGWFGPIPQQHLARVGDVVVACRERWVVLASAHEPAKVSRMVAFHGSSTAAEMQIPLLVVRR
ncbi:alkaline phosphatase family protein [Dactylosporangium roseum]|uniref:Alkaline phosphatase family protein n=1 Tax=Dactylosporangium roseum TaxID=47989 RepID=A0ABY5YZR1_9ACTN|nr:nucleotide pyrophosphatase/phosphodiesterase family protein [Dactylosporangium roseum]UWZ35245.1 alkaline phosphatase family protein [Dactylosporangium roseum]